jgi:hypothetical protein
MRLTRCQAETKADHQQRRLAPELSCIAHRTRPTSRPRPFLLPNIYSRCWGFSPKKSRPYVPAHRAEGAQARATPGNALGLEFGHFALGAG